MRVAVARGLAHTAAAMPADNLPTDELLMERYRDGEAGAFDLLYTRHKGGVYRYMLRQCGERGVAEELRYQAGTWDIRAKADVSYYDFPVRTISTSDVTLFNKWNLSLRLRAEKRLASFLKVYAEYEHERSLSNEDFEKYSVNTVLGGLQWEF